MQHRTIIAVTKDSEWMIGMRPVFHGAGSGSVVVAESVEEAERLLDVARPRMVVVDWHGEDVRPDAIDALLWKNSTQARPASVVIVAHDYRVDEATLMFRLGVDEYIGGTEHREALGSIMTTLAPPSSGTRRIPALASSKPASQAAPDCASVASLS